MTDEELRGLFQGLEQRMDRRLGELNDKLDYFMDDTTKKFALVHEGLVMLNEKIDREAGDIRSEMRAGFEETHALIRFSHAELDRRVTRLENEVF